MARVARRIYGRMVEEFGFREVREVSSVEVQRQLDHWSEEPPVGMVLRGYLGIKPPPTVGYDAGRAPEPRHLSVEQLDRIAEQHRVFAQKYGRGNPWQ